MKKLFSLLILMYNTYNTTIARDIILFYVGKRNILLQLRRFLHDLYALHYMRLYIIIRHIESATPPLLLTRSYNR